MCSFPSARTISLIALVAVAVLVIATRSFAQALEVEALAGTPFGVGRITVPIAAGQDSVVFESNAFALHEQNRRALYPVFTNGRILTLVRGLLGRDQAAGSSSVTALFLFTGSEPLRLTVHAPAAHTVVASPRLQPRMHGRLLMRWWREYHAAARERQRVGDYPPIVETYLTTTLSQRLGLAPPLLSRRAEQQRSEPQEALEVLTGVESMRIRTMKDTLLGRYSRNEPADQPVPPDIRWSPTPLPATDPNTPIEPIAMHVPAECLYVRFGRFSNYLWMNRLMQEHGGDISRMVTLRGHNARLNERLQQQLGLKESALAEVLGDQVISDVALIGRDMYLREGAAVGILFEARNDLLSGDITRQRAAARKKFENIGASEEKLTIAGRDVSLVSTPDNRLRSFYVADGRYHLVTTSRAMIRRFLEVAQGQQPLGATQEFQLARQTMPLEREDTIFVYLSTEFLKALVSPQYQVELRRRLQAVTDLELVRLARLSARAEGKDGKTIDALVAGGLLPRNFGLRPDGSRPVVQEDRITDSLRGARGTFTPIPDVPLTGVTRSESYRCGELAAFHERQWNHMDPLLVGVKRYALDQNGQKGLERISIDAWLLPFDRQKYGKIISVVGPPSRRQVQVPPDDVISVQGVLQGGMFNPAVQTHQVFLGVKDMVPPGDFSQAPLLRKLQIVTSAPAYLGAWPKMGLLDMLPLGPAAQPDAFGYSRFPFGLWRRESLDGFSVLSFHRPILEAVTPHVRLEEADNEAQLRVRVRDLSQSKISQWLTMLNHQRAYQTSLGNTRFLHALSQQFQLPREETLETAQALLDVQLICALDGEYRLAEPEGGLKHWVSTSWPGFGEGQDGATLEDYQAPILKWFRGLEANVTMLDDKLIVHAELDMQRKERERKIELPLFNFFKKPKSQAKPAEDKPQAPQPEELPAPKPTPTKKAIEA